jgi:L-cysteine S-thiosulfotransferase
MSKLFRLAALTTVLCGMLPASASDIPLADRKSAYTLMGREIQTMQDDDTANPGMLSVFDGEALWSKKAGAAEKSCADCHGDARESMRGVAARYPAYHTGQARPIDLEQRINICRVEQQIATPLKYESKELLALTAYVGLQSRGMPLQPTDDRLRPFIEAGRETFNRRQGQINLSCAQCHDERWGKRLAGSVIPQGHATGYPLYRLEWQALGSLQRRLRNCLTGMRAELYPLGAPEYVDLQLYLMWRARGMAVETPAVRP